MVKKSKLSILVLLLITVILVGNLSLPTNAVEAELKMFDYVDETSSVSERVLDASEFVELIMGEELCEAEKQYLNSIFENIFVYSDCVPVSSVAAVYEDGKVKISAESYEYVAKSGSSVYWIPKRAVIGELESELKYSDETRRYEGSIVYDGAIGTDEMIFVDIEYVFSFTVPADTADAYKNYAYKRSLAISDEEKEYEVK